MVIPAYTTDLTLMDAAENDTNWAEATASGWTAVFAVTGGDTDDFIQNAACNSSTFKTGVGVLLYDNSGGITLNQDDAVLIWAKWDAGPGLDTDANGGMRTVMGNSLSAFNSFDQSGSDSYTYGGWKNFATGDPADSEVTPDDVVGGPTTVKQFHGWAANALSVPSKGNPYKVDVIRYGRCEIRVNGGETNDFAIFFGMATENDLNVTSFNRWGLFQAVDGGYLWKGLMTLGYTSAVDFRDSNAFITVDDTPHCTKNFNLIEIDQAGSRVDWTSITFVSLGTKSPGRFVMLAAADVNFVSCSFSDMDTFIFLSSASVLNTSFIRCNTITHGGCVMNGSLILEAIVAVNDGALVYGAAVDPDGFVDDMTFSMGTVSHHAIDFGTAVDSSLVSITLRGIAFDGFGAVDDADASTVRFLALSGSLTLNLIDCTVDGVSPVASGGGQNFSVDDAAGMTVTVVVAPVTLLISITDEADGQPIQDVQTSIHLKDSPFTELMNEDSTAGGLASESYAGSTPVDIVWKTRKSDELDTPRYFAQSGLGEITTSGFTQSVLMKENTIIP